MKFVSISQRSVEVILVVVGTFLSDINNILRSTVCYYGPSSVTESVCDSCVNSVDLIQRLLLSTLVFVFGQRHFKAHAELRKSIHTYDVRTTQIAVEDDREMILQFIDELFQTPGLENGREVSFTNLPRAPSERRQTGIDAFNRAVQENVPSQLPVQGMKSWKVVSYVPAVLLMGQKIAFWIYDDWSYNGRRRGYDNAWNGFCGVCFLAWCTLVLFPFKAYLWGCTVKVFMLAQDWVTAMTGWNAWISYVISLC